MARLGLALLVAALAAGHVTGQEPSDIPRVTESVEVSVRSLDVVVTDRHGRSVHDLLAEDFELLVGKKPVPITNFREERRVERTPAPPPLDGTQSTPEPPPPETPRERRHIVLFVDHLALPEEWQRNKLFGALKSLLRKALGPGDDAMVVLWQRSVRAVQPFTSDLAALDRALDAIARSTARGSGEKQTLNELANLKNWFELVAADIGDPLSRAEEGMSTPRGLEATDAFQDMKGKTAALKSVIAAMAGMEGRKAVVLAAQRFSRYPGLEFFLEARAKPEDALNLAARAFDAKSLLEDVAETANTASVTLYTLLPFGMDVPMASAADPLSSRPRDIVAPLLGGREQIVESNEMQALELIADRTGGVTSRAGIAGFVEQVASDLGSWYSVGISSRTSAERSRTVKVRMRKPGLKARVRRAIVDKDPEARMEERVLANLFRPDENPKLPIRVVAGSPGKESDRVRVSVGIPIGKLALLPAGAGLRGAFSIFVAWATPSGRFSSVVRRHQDLQIPPSDIERAKAGTYGYDLEIVTNDARAGLARRLGRAGRRRRVRGLPAGKGTLTSRLLAL